MAGPSTSLAPADAGRIVWRPQPGPQECLLACPIPDVLYGGSRGGGKTDGFLGKWAQRYATYGGRLRGLFMRRSYDELDEVAARSLEIYPAIGGVWRQQRRTWYFPGGARLKMRSLERDADASKYQGHSYTDIYVDEAGNFPDPNPLRKLKATLRNPYGIPPFYGKSANPGGPGHAWIKEEYIDPAPDGFTPIADPVTGELRVYIPSRLEDNRILMETDPHYRNRIMQSGPAWLVRAWLSGDWNATPEGGLIKGAWFRRYKTLPAEFLRIVQSWDTAYKPEEINDPSVCTTWGETRHGYYLLDVFRQRMEYPALKRAVASLAERWRPSAVLVEDKGSGISLIQELRAATSVPVIPIDPKGVNKVDRLVAASSLFEAGLVHVPAVSAWGLDYEIEMTIFPLAGHDDQVDSTSQALKWMHRLGTRIESTGTGVMRAAMADGPIDDDHDDDASSIASLNDFGGFA